MLKNKTSTVCILVVAGLWLAANDKAFAAEVTCGGYSTLLYANNKVALTICHGPYTKVDRTRLDHWQDCDDAMIHLRDKTKGETTEYADCLPGDRKQFRVKGDAFMLRHFYATYPGRFESKPLLVETLNLTTNTRTYQFEKRFPACTRRDIDDSTKQIDSATAKPFDGKTFFDSVYGGFYKLRDCAQSDPKLVLAILQRYGKSDLFDGEVAETLGSVASEVELIDAATKR
ncbi:MAG: hypothetical protein ROZ09_03630 [Thiobacillus sp.]|uniref:hypothetical protein n=1 Tax=Thiobacillus sp. TaxID=924 RepID=UPI00289611E1|nr:hypothetical protein [Thiobacillus sp.]MDT3705893.1 hypothetical protein [Thiobacillus sp.]